MNLLAFFSENQSGLAIAGGLTAYIIGLWPKVGGAIKRWGELPEPDSETLTGMYSELSDDSPERQMIQEIQRRRALSAVKTYFAPPLGALVWFGPSLVVLSGFTQLMSDATPEGSGLKSTLDQIHVSAFVSGVVASVLTCVLAITFARRRRAISAFSDAHRNRRVDNDFRRLVASGFKTQGVADNHRSSTGAHDVSAADMAPAGNEIPVA